LAVTISFISVQISLLLPAIRAARSSAEITEVRCVALEICFEAQNFREANGWYPENLPELALFASGDWTWTLSETGVVITGDDRHQLYYTTNLRRMRSWLTTLESIAPESKEFIDFFFVRQNPGPLMVLVANHPRYPWMGRTFIYLDVQTCEYYVVRDFDKLRDQRDAVEVAALQASAKMLLNEVDPIQSAHEIPLILREPDGKQFVIDTFDQNADGEITMREASSYIRQLAEQDIGDESSLGARVIKQFCSFVVEDVQLTSADDEDDTVLPLDGEGSDREDLYSYQNLCEQTRLYVDNDRIERALCGQLRLAQFLEEHDLLRLRDEVLSAEQQLLDRQSGKSLLPEDSEELSILTEVRKGYGR
jgi:hypothetical protein